MPACHSFLLRTEFCDKITGLLKTMGYIKLLELYFAATKTEKKVICFKGAKKFSMIKTYFSGDDLGL